ncbi:TetR/AcrR family transcriptional regulator [Nocardia sp. NPDC057353]|uniref:TetR/AcrR family transcriptional regulator n=1 Tax=Nocardia sp. NPDC057353 TaxID=3346104 RepID=UPI0036398620
MTDSPNARRPSLAERRRVQAMHEIQDVALELFERDGYRSVPIERIAAAVGTSASTVYRYFGTKEMLVVWDDYDPQILDLLATADPEPVAPEELIEQVRAAALPLAGAFLTTDEAKIRSRMRLVAAEPDVRAGQLRLAEQLTGAVRVALAARLHRDENDLTLRLAAAQAVWGFLAVIDHWVASGFEPSLREVFETGTETIARSLRAVLVATD